MKAYEGGFGLLLDYFGSTWAQFRKTLMSLWNQFGITLGIGCDFGSLRGHLGTFLCHLVALLGSTCGHFKSMKATLGHFEIDWEAV